MTSRRVPSSDRSLWSRSEAVEVTSSTGVSESEPTAGGGESGVGINEAGTRIDGSGTAVAAGAGALEGEPDAGFAFPLPLAGAPAGPAPGLPGGAGRVPPHRL